MSSFDPGPPSQWQLVSQGAEARVWKVPARSNNPDVATTAPTYMICKERFAKSYRHPDLDAKLTKSRCRSEARLLEKCVKLGLGHAVPSVQRLDPPKLYLEYLDGPNLKTYLQGRSGQCQKQQKQKRQRVESSPKKNGLHHDQLEGTDKDPNYDDGNRTDEDDSLLVDFDALAKQIGHLIGKLHSIDIIHGDLTTSNMMVRVSVKTQDGNKTNSSNSNNKKNSVLDLMLIDFGLGKSTTSVEEHAVDLYVLERALQSTHPELPAHFFDGILKEYSKQLRDPGKSKDVLRRLEEVQKRGRKRECFG